MRAEHAVRSSGGGEAVHNEASSRATPVESPLARMLGHRVEITVVERLWGDGHVFERDRLPCTEEERRLTLVLPLIPAEG